jgi:type II secretory pathway component GspD/PulD (secretin)
MNPGEKFSVPSGDAVRFPIWSVILAFALIAGAAPEAGAETAAETGAAEFAFGEEWQGDPSAYMVAMEILVVEVNENRTRELGLNYGLARSGESGSVLEGASLLVGPVRAATPVPTFSGDALGRVTLGSEPRVPGLGVNLVGMDINGHVLSVRLRALLEKGEARITSRPVVLALHGTPASISVGSEVPYQDVRVKGNHEEPVVAFENVGVKMEIVPVIRNLAHGVVDLDVRKVEVSSVSNFLTIRRVDRPIFETAETRTRITMHSGETIQMSSLKGRRARMVRQGVPGLMHIPLLGHLFSSREEVYESVDILFFLTPHLVPPGRNLLLPYDFSRGQELISHGVEIPSF